MNTGNTRFKSSLLLYVFVFFTLFACGIPANEQLAQKHLREAKQAVSEGRFNDAAEFLQLIPKKTETWTKEGKVIEERLKQRNVENLQKAKEALATGKLEDAKNYLNLLDLNSEEWKNQGMTLFNEVWEKERTSPERIKRDKEAADYARNLKYQGRGPKFSWERGGFGTVAILTSITIENTSNDTCRDIAGTMSFFAASGTRLGSLPFVVYDIVPPHSKRTFRNINIGILPPPVDQVKSAGIEIVDCK